MRTSLVYQMQDKGHHKEKFPTFTQYLVAGAPNPLPGGDTMRYVRNGAITPLSSIATEVSEYTKELVLQFLQVGRTQREGLSHVRPTKGVHIGYVPDPRRECLQKGGGVRNITIRERFQSGEQRKLW
jgi:hypothetical protein